ncbi:MAG: class I SAM-dependent methyltransferase, partial [Acidimicrobiia bacterium]|nr:class I SAM-dependent methyltransferase [Acidimicrobiia bacterium]
RAWRAAADRLPRKVTRPLRVTKRALVDSGYLKSNWRNQAVDASGQPTPWYTFPALAYLASLDFSGKEVFEFGSGNSTLYWQRRAARVTAVEHDEEWHALVAPRLDPARATVRLARAEDEYVAAVDDGRDRGWDVIVVDGLHRTACARRAVKRLAPGGLLILDNADWFPEIAAELRGAELLEVDFHGQGAINFYVSTTSVFFDRQAHPLALGPQPVPAAGSIPFPGPAEVR